jgi:hypothetical protein
MSDEETFDKLKKDLGVDENKLPTVEDHKLVGNIGFSRRTDTERQQEHRAKKKKKRRPK